MGKEYKMALDYEPWGKHIEETTSAKFPILQPYDAVSDMLAKIDMFNDIAVKHYNENPDCEICKKEIAAYSRESQ